MDRLGHNNKTITAAGSGDHTLVLGGCAPTPLASYLKALGILRLVAEQADQQARGRWEGESFILHSYLDCDGLTRFFENGYQPTPMVGPWNGKSGFYPGDNKSGIDPIANSRTERFEEFRSSIRKSYEILEHLGFGDKPDKDRKPTLLAYLRAEVGESLLAWLDAAILLSEDGPKYPPLLGTGGNDGRLDFTNNFMQRLVEVIDPDTGELRPEGSRWLEPALLGTPAPGLSTKAIGQFMPGAAGGPNAHTGFEAGSLINPWDFILMLEGALLFASVATRRHTQYGEGQLSYPFTVRPTGSGSGATHMSDESPARAEIWMPLWDRPLGLPELRTLLGEGRVTLGRRAARDGLDFVRAAAKLGVERGISAFQRYGFMQRSGKAYLATPLNRIPVRRNPHADLIDQLESNQFLDRFRRFARSDQASHRAKSLARILEDALFELARRHEPESPLHLQAVIEALGDIVLHLQTSPAARKACPRLPWLDAQWITKGDDHSPEFRIAAAFAGLGSSDMPMISHLLPVNRHELTRLEDESRSVVWHHGDLTSNVVAVARRRLVEAATNQRELNGLPRKPFAGRPPATTGTVAAFLAEETDDMRVTRLLCGLALVRRPPPWLPATSGGPERDAPLPAAYRILKPLFVPDAELRSIGELHEHETLPLPDRLPALLAAGRVQEALDAGLRRLRASGHPAAFGNLTAPQMPGSRLLAALAVPLDPRTLRRFLRRVRPPLEEQTGGHGVPGEGTHHEAEGVIS